MAKIYLEIKAKTFFMLNTHKNLLGFGFYLTGLDLDLMAKIYLEIKEKNLCFIQTKIGWAFSLNLLI